MSSSNVSVDKFKADLRLISLEEVFDNYVKPLHCHGLDNALEVPLRSCIADYFKINVSSVIIVGSGKLGFTIIENRKKGRPAFSSFDDSSDIDVAIISNVLFDLYWKQALEHFLASGYQFAQDGLGKAFGDHIFRGWMRPDKLPNVGSFALKSKWFDFFRKITYERLAGGAKITAAVYREEYFLRMNQYSILNVCKINLNLNK